MKGSWIKYADQKPPEGDIVLWYFLNGYATIGKIETDPKDFVDGGPWLDTGGGICRLPLNVLQDLMWQPIVPPDRSKS